MKLIKFYATWCEPCKALSSMIESMKDEISIPIEEVDIEKDMDAAVKYRVRGVPTMVIVDGDKEIRRQVGMLQKEQLKAFLQA